MQNKEFRNRDRVTVHWGNGRVSKGRVICHNRRNKYGLSVIVLFESQSGDEICESFLPTGKRWATNDPIYLTHGWEGKDTG